MTALDDDTVGCPGCGDTISAVLLCEHDDPDSGPLCIDRCCPWHHGPVEAA